MEYRFVLGIIFIIASIAIFIWGLVWSFSNIYAGGAIMCMAFMVFLFGFSVVRYIKKHS